MPAAIVALLLLCAPPPTPEWKKPVIRGMVGRIQAAARAPSIAAKDTELATVGGMAYAVERRPGEQNEVFAKRIVRGLDPTHPNVKEGQWLSALMRQLYVDISKRCRDLARFEEDRRDRRFLEQMSKDASQVAQQIAATLELSVEGLEGFVEPLPIATGDDPAGARGAMAMVRQQKITIENLDRITFVGHQPPDGTARTARGAIREVFSAQRQYNVSAQMLGRYEKEWRRNLGHIRIVVPAGYPAIYLNEIVRGALEAKMTTAHLMTMTRRGDLRRIELAVEFASKKKKPPPKKKKKKKKRKKRISVSCPDDLVMQECVKKIAHARTLGSPVYSP